MNKAKVKTLNSRQQKRIQQKQKPQAEQFNAQIYVDDNMRLVKSVQWLKTLEELNDLYTEKTKSAVKTIDKKIEVGEAKLKVLNIRAEIVAQKRNISEMEFRIKDYEKRFNKTLDLARHELPQLIEDGRGIYTSKKNQNKLSPFVAEIQFVIESYDDVMDGVDVDKVLDAIKPTDDDINHRKHMVATYKALKIGIENYKKDISK